MPCQAAPMPPRDEATRLHPVLVILLGSTSLPSPTTLVKSDIVAALLPVLNPIKEQPTKYVALKGFGNVIGVVNLLLLAVPLPTNCAQPACTKISPEAS